MPKEFFKQIAPKPKQLKKNRQLKFLAFLWDDPYLFHMNRKSVANACFIGFFVGFLPILGQLPLAAALAVILRANLPITATLVCFSNPITSPFIFYACYRFGSFVLMKEGQSLNFELSLTWFNSTFQLIWQPLLVGSLLCSLFFSCFAYLCVQWLWRWRTSKKWRQRH